MMNIDQIKVIYNTYRRKVKKEGLRNVDETTRAIWHAASYAQNMYVMVGTEDDVVSSGAWTRRYEEAVKELENLLKEEG